MPGAGINSGDDVERGPHEAGGGGTDLGAAAPAGHGQHIAVGGGDAVEGAEAAELAAAAAGAVAEVHGLSMPTWD